MITQVIHCFYCNGMNLVKHGKTPQGKQRCRCRSELYQGRTFLLDYSYPGQSKQVKEKIIDMTVNGSGIRHTVRVLSKKV